MDDETSTSNKKIITTPADQIACVGICLEGRFGTTAFSTKKKMPGSSSHFPINSRGALGHQFPQEFRLAATHLLRKGVDNTTTRNRKKKNTETQLLNHFLFKMLMYQLPILHTGELFSSTFFFLNRKIDTDRGKQVGTKQVQEPSNKHHKRNPCAAWDRWDWYIYRTFSGLLYIFMVNS